MSEIYLLTGMVIVTFLIRYTLFAVSGRLEFPERLLNALRYVPPTVLTAIIVPAVLIPNGETIQISAANPYLAGAVVAFAVGWWRRSLLLTIVIGMLAFLVWQWGLVALNQ
ncbi:MAG: AzlD domain-containing protein [Anaerolineae bacterium]|nr:AzlD domain-containing protein [Anaerolineae bacterium]